MSDRILTFTGVLVVFHMMAVAAFWSFTWTNLAVALFLYWVSIGLGTDAMLMGTTLPNSG